MTKQDTTKTPSNDKKECYVCGIKKPLTDFHRNKYSADGRQSRCAVCKSIVDKKYRSSDSARNKAKVYSKRYRITENGKRVSSSYRSKYRQSKPEVILAHHAVENAINCGKITRPDYCTMCRSFTSTVGHHWSYKQEHWLDIEWLCPKCHASRHSTAKGKRQ